MIVFLSSTHLDSVPSRVVFGGRSIFGGGISKLSLSYGNKVQYASLAWLTYASHHKNRPLTDWISLAPKALARQLCCRRLFDNSFTRAYHFQSS